MWMAWSIPLMAVGVAIAVVPVMWGSVLNHRQERREVVRAATADAVAPAAVQMRVDCPLCAEPLYASSSDELVDHVGRHAWRSHGIPSRAHILETSLAG